MTGGEIRELPTPASDDAKRLLGDALARADEFEHVIILVYRKDNGAEVLKSADIFNSRAAWLNLVFQKWLQDNCLS